jgi:hypothetical protein
MEYFPYVLKSRAEQYRHSSINDLDEALQELCIIYQGKPLAEPHLFCHGDYLDEDILYEYATNPRLRTLADWAMRRVVLENILTWTTMHVRLKIAVNAMRAIPMNNISSNMRIIMQDNLVQNLWSVHRAKLEKDLPF